MKLLLLSLGAFLVTFGIILIYDARIVTRKFLSFGDQNEAAIGLKMFGFIFAVIGGLLVFFYL